MSEQRIHTKVTADVSSHNSAMDEAARKTQALGQAAQQQAGPLDRLGGALDEVGEAAQQQAGGVDAAALSWRGLAGVAELAVGALGGLGAIAATVGVAVYQASQESAALSQALIMTGGAAGVSADALMQMSRDVAAATGETRSAAAAAAAAVAGSGKVAAGALEQVTTAALQMQSVGAQAMRDTVAQFAELGRDPVAAAAALHEETGFLTAAVYEQIVALDEQGRTAEAAELAQSAYADTLTQRAADIQGSLGLLESTWNTLGAAAKQAWDWMLNVGREDTLEEQLAAAKERAANGVSTWDRVAGFFSGDTRTENDEGAIQARIDAEKALAEQKAEQARLAQAAIEWQNISLSVADRQAKIEAEVVRIRAAGVAAKKDEAEIERTIAAYREKNTPKASTGGGRDNSAAAAREAAAALREQEKAQRAALKAEQDAIKLAEQGLASLQNQVERQREANAEIGLTGVALAELRAARLEDAAATNEQAAAAAELLGKSPAEIQAYKDKAAALRELAKLTREGAAQKDAQEQLAAQEDAALKAAEAWARESEKIGDSLTDALMRGWENGKGGLENLRDTAVNMFKTMVLRPLLQPIMGSVAGLLMGAVPGMAGAAGGGGGGGGMGDISSLFSLGNIGNTLSIGSQVLGGTMSIANAAGTMFANATGTGISGLLATNGAYGTAAGAMGTLGAALPYLGIGLMAISLLSGAFDKPSNKSAWGDVNLASGAISGLDQLDGDKSPSEQTIAARDLFLATLGNFGANVGSTGSLRVDIGERDGIQAAFNGGELQGYGSDADAAMMAIMDEIIKSATIDPQVVAQWQVLKVSLDGTAKSASDMADVMALLVNDVSMVDIERAALIQGENESLGQSYLRLAEMMGTVMTASEQWRAAQHGLADEFAQLGLAVPQTREAFADLLEGIDITTDEGRELFRALADLGPAFLQVANAVEQALQAISDGTQESIRDIELSVLDDRGKYAYLQDELTAGETALREAVDPAEVARIAEENRALIMNAWQLVPENLRASLADEFIDLLNDNEALAAERLSTVDPEYDPAEESAQDDVEDSMTKAVTEALQVAAEKMSAAGDNQLAAAEVLSRALGSLRDDSGGGGATLNLQEPRFA